MSTPLNDSVQRATGPDQRIVMYSTSWCSDCRRARRVFAEMDVSYDDIDIEADPAAAEMVKQINGGMSSVPTIRFPDGTVLVEPSNAVLEAKISALAGR